MGILASTRHGRTPIHGRWVMLPKDLVERATKATGVGLTPTIRQGLESVVLAGAYRRIRERRGKVHLTINVDELREDRD